MASLRRRHHHHHRFQYLVPVISAIFVALFILFCLLSIFAPSPVDLDRIRDVNRQSQSESVDDGGVSVFRVPVRICG